MKAEELMIGDWLFYKGQFATFPFKVKQITKKKVGYHAEPDENRIHYLRLSECNPIPLTPEILEKNGFPFNESETTGSIQSVYKHYTKFFDFPLGRGFYIELDTVDNVFCITDHWWIRFKYVHEFQHILKMCGINPDIEV